MAQLALFDIAKVEIKLWKKNGATIVFQLLFAMEKKDFFEAHFFATRFTYIKIKSLSLQG